MGDDTRMGRALGGVTKKSISIDHWEKSPEVIVCKTGISIAGYGNAAAGFEETEAYVPKKQNTVAQYIVTQPILYLFKETVRISGVWVMKRWWDQEGMELAGAREAAIRYYY